MKYVIGILLTLALFLLIVTSVTAQTRHYPFSMEYNPQRTLLNSFKTPPGYERYPLARMDRFMLWVTNLPLKKKEYPVVQWNREVLISPDSICGVIDLGVISRNQKDADLPLQFVLEHLRSENRLEDFPVIINKSDTVYYGKWLTGKYKTTARNDIIYEKDTTRPASEKEFYRFLEFCMNWTENKTLLMNLKPVEPEDIAPGDLYLQFDAADPDSAGHAAMILDVCYGENEDIRLMAGWGGIPPHNFYLPKPRPGDDKPWMKIAELKRLLSEYGDGRFYRFKNL